jgi:hypothetical protein
MFSLRVCLASPLAESSALSAVQVEVVGCP